MQTRCLALALFLFLLGWPSPAWAEWQVRPFVGIVFGGGTTFVDLEDAAERPNFIYGVSGGWLGEVFGLEGDVGRAPGFFQTGDQGLLLGSSVTTLTGNVVIALPRRMAEYALRPYFVAGAGLMHVQIDGRLGALQISRTLPAMDVGGGVTGFLSDRVGLSWDVRRFRTLRSSREATGVSFGEERLAFWRANMAVALRY
jgi:hypothetical protein